jgi:hypothetical protein
MNVILTLNAGLGADLGPNFTLVGNIGTVTPNTATKTELLAGKSLVIDNAATSVRVTSVGTCTNYTTVSLTALYCDFAGGTAVANGCVSATYSVQNTGTVTIRWEGTDCDGNLDHGYVQEGQTRNTTCVLPDSVTVDYPEFAVITFIDFC